eukprot:g6095.t1
MNAVTQAFSACAAATQVIEDMSHVVLGLVLSNCAWVATRERDVASRMMSEISQPLTVAAVGGIELSQCRIDRDAIRLICDLISKSNEAPRSLNLRNTKLSLDTVRDLTTFAKSRVDGLRVSELCVQEEEGLGDEGITILCRGIGDFFVRKWELRELRLELCGM